MHTNDVHHPKPLQKRTIVRKTKTDRKGVEHLYSTAYDLFEYSTSPGRFVKERHDWPYQRLPINNSHSPRLPESSTSHDCKVFLSILKPMYRFRPNYIIRSSVLWVRAENEFSTNIVLLLEQMLRASSLSSSSNVAPCPVRYKS